MRWEPVDEATALLVVPFGEERERFVARFDGDAGLLWLLESMRYREADDAAKTLWLNEVRAWGRVDGHLLPVRTSLTWWGEGGSWARWTVEDVAYNVDLGTDLRADRNARAPRSDRPRSDRP